eukprot:1207145-Amphidinium_carterae.1
MCQKRAQRGLILFYRLVEYSQELVGHVAEDDALSIPPLFLFFHLLHQSIQLVALADITEPLLALVLAKQEK